MRNLANFGFCIWEPFSLDRESKALIRTPYQLKRRCRVVQQREGRVYFSLTLKIKKCSTMRSGLGHNPRKTYRGWELTSAGPGPEEL